MLNKNPQATVTVVVKGHVQGVGFRYFVVVAAQRYQLVGWVSNWPDGTVHAEAVGDREKLKFWVRDLRKGPPLARVTSVDVMWDGPVGTFETFSIR